jgi:glycosyltransferase involved in cell wall biosynthesis
MLAIAKYLARHDYRILLTGIGTASAPPQDVAYRAIAEHSWMPFLAMTAAIGNFIALLRWRPEFVIVSKPLPPSIFPALLYKNISGARLILDFDDVEHDYWRHKPLYSRILRLTERFAACRADAVTTHSVDLRKYLIDKLHVPENRLWFLPQGVDTELFVPRDADAELRRSLRLDGKAVIVYAAHFTVAVKDFEFILQMMAQLSGDVKDAVLLVIGDGPGCAAYRNRVKELGISEIVRFAGYVRHEDIGKYFDIGHVAINYLAPTPANICRASIKLREYLLRGLWVVCNDVSEDTRQFEKVVLTFRTGDLDGFCGQVKEAVSRARQGRNAAAAEYMANDFSLKNIVAALALQLKTLRGSK